MCNKIKPEELVKLTIDPYIAMDNNGKWYTYSRKPTINKTNNGWSSCGEFGGIYLNIDYDGDWKDSLFTRIKEPVLRPLTYDELLDKLKCGVCYLEMIRPKRVVSISALMHDNIYINYTGSIKECHTYNELMHKFTFLNGEPCGVYE